MRRIYKHWGPSAQTCIQLTRDTTAEARHEAAVKLAASQFVKDTDAIGECFDERTPHVLLSISPRKENRQIPTADIATDRILTIISYALADAQAQEQIKFYHDLSRETMFRASADKIYKRFVLTWLTSGRPSLDISCFPLGPHPCHWKTFEISPYGEMDVISGRLATLKSMQVTPKNLRFCFLPVLARGSQPLTTVDAIIFTTAFIFTIQVTSSDQNGATYEEDFAEIEKNLPTITIIHGSPPTRCHLLITDGRQEMPRGQTLAATLNLTCIYTLTSWPGKRDISSEQMMKLDEAWVRVLVACERSILIEGI
jgi:hypothetical protein